MRLVLLLAACTLPVTAATAVALDVTGETLEVLVGEASAVGEYEVHASPSEQTSYDAWVRTEVRTTLVASLYGEPPEEEAIPLAVRRDEIRTRVPAAGTLLLVFFPADPSQDPVRIPLEGPGGERSPVLWGTALTADFGVLTDGSSILARVRLAIAARQHPNAEGCANLVVEESIPDTSAAYRALWQRGRVTLRAPFQERHRRVLRALAVDGRGLERARAACLLARCSPGDLSEDLLREMLEDPGTTMAWTGETIHPARWIAYRLLKARGRDVDPPAEYREDDRLDLPCGEAARVSFEDRLAMTAHLLSAGFRAAVRETVPEYPVPLLEEGVEGKVSVLLAVDGSGGVTGSRVSAVTVDAPPAALETDLVAAARGWRFRPVTAGGSPVAATVVVPLRVTGDDAPPPARFSGNRPYDDTCTVRSLAVPWSPSLPRSIVVEVDVDEWGNTIRARPGPGARGGEAPGMRAVLDAAASWTFSPATVHGIAEPATVSVLLGPPRTALSPESGARCRFFPDGGVQPDGPLEIVDASLPARVGLWGWEGMSVICHVGRDGRVDAVGLPSPESFRPLAEAALAVSRDWEFDAESGDPDRVVDVPITFTFRLPTFVPGVGLVRHGSF